VIEVSRGAIVSSLFAGDRYVVPFRVVTIDGEELRSAAVMARVGGSIESLTHRAPFFPPRSDDTPRLDEPAPPGSRRSVSRGC